MKSFRTSFSKIISFMYLRYVPVQLFFIHFQENSKTYPGCRKKESLVQELSLALTTLSLLLASTLGYSRIAIHQKLFFANFY